jgi:parallel beta-helix repeat protein
VLDGTNLGGIGIHESGTSGQHVTGVQVSGFDVSNFAQGIVLDWAADARIHRNYVHHNRRLPAPQVFTDSNGIVLHDTVGTEIRQNVVTENGMYGITLVRSAGNRIIGNRVEDNGAQFVMTFGAPGAVGITITGVGSHDNQVVQNHVLRNQGWGIRITRPTGLEPLSGNLVAQNRIHENQRSGIMVLGSAAGNLILQNDARGNNLSGLPPCYQCNLMEMMTAGPNVWERNLGTVNLTDACAP